MEQSFSQRMGFKSTKNAFQINSMDDDLRNGLWNAYVQFIKEGLNSYAYWELACKLWNSYFKLQRDDIPFGDNSNRTKKIHPFIKEKFFAFKWHEVYDFIEFVAKIYPIPAYLERYTNACNETLKRELSYYQFIGTILVPITSDQEITEIKQALDITKLYSFHLDKALKLLADRSSPDYANSIKESISAVEAICKLIMGNNKATLGEALRQLENKLGILHPALKSAFNSLYGYTSDAEGIRHGMLGASSLDIEDARFMLIACSAFINYLDAKASKAKIELSQN